MRQAARAVGEAGFASIGRTLVDPGANGVVQDLSRPEGIALGFSLFQYSTAFKLLEFVKEIAPPTARIAFRNVPCRTRLDSAFNR